MAQDDGWRHQAQVMVTPQVLGWLLAAPHTAKVTASWNEQVGMVRLLVDWSRFPALPHGAEPPYLHLIEQGSEGPFRIDYFTELPSWFREAPTDDLAEQVAAQDDALPELDMNEYRTARAEALGDGEPTAAERAREEGAGPDKADESVMHSGDDYSAVSLTVGIERKSFDLTEQILAGEDDGSVLGQLTGHAENRALFLLRQLTGPVTTLSVSASLANDETLEISWGGSADFDEPITGMQQLLAVVRTWALSDELRTE